MRTIHKHFNHENIKVDMESHVDVIEPLDTKVSLYGEFWIGKYKI